MIKAMHKKLAIFAALVVIQSIAYGAAAVKAAEEEIERIVFNLKSPDGDRPGIISYIKGTVQCSRWLVRNNKTICNSTLFGAFGSYG